MSDLPYSLLKELEQVSTVGLPPVHLWQPELEKDIDLRIDSEGRWHYEGTVIKRPRLVRLFASVLRREDDEYFLVTPVEKCRIVVEDVPFQVVLMENLGTGEKQQIRFTTDMAEQFDLDAKHPLRICRPESDSGEGEWIPYVLARDGMEARLQRNVYYQLMELLEAGDYEGESWLGLYSHGNFFPVIADAAG